MSDWEHRDLERGIDEAKRLAQDVRDDLDRAKDNLERKLHALSRDLAVQGSTLVSDIGNLAEQMKTPEAPYHTHCPGCGQVKAPCYGDRKDCTWGPNLCRCGKGVSDCATDGCCDGCDSPDL